ncbi:MAG TPA: winged helix-turn-helix domain-containing protein [Caulobacteraceae bacterium]|nr:winged helix-turn-helix domain-containing protein [Caulobacteraceae bacterium]
MRRFADQSPMIDAPEPARASRPVNLAREADFRLGALLIRPSLREVQVGADRQILEPRVMQVLVALARMDGQVVSRDELIEACWGGRIVGEDAINRCIARLRRLAEACDGCFAIDTVARVGYRLKGAGGEIAPSAAGRARGTDRRMAAGLAMAAALLLVSAAVGWHLTHPRPYTVESSKLLVSALPIERHPAISPDGGTIAYSGGVDIMTRQIYLRSLAGGAPMQLTSEPGDHVSASWSPDGTRLAYVVATAGEPCRIVVRPVRGGAARDVARCAVDERSQVIWDRSGESLYFIDRSGQDASDRIVRLDLATGRRGDLTHPPAGSPGDSDLGLSPDGRFISFQRSLSDMAGPLMIRDLRSGAERSLAKPIDLNPGGWTSDSRAVLLAGRVNGDNVIWAYPIDGRRPQHLMSGPLIMGRLATGPKDLAAVEVDTEVYNLASPPLRKGGEPVILDPSKGIDGAPTVAANGAIAMAGWRSGEAGIWIKPPGGAVRQLVRVDPDSDLDGGPSFSPDGQRLAFPTQAGGHLAIRIVDLTGRDLGAVRFFGSELGVPAWEGDGRSLIFAGRDAGGWRLWRAPASPVGDAAPASAYGWLSVQTSGQALYGVRAGAPGVWRIDGTPKRITVLPRPAFPNLWTIAGADIDYVDNPFGHPPHIVSQPIAGGPPRVIAEAPGYAYDKGFAVNPATGAVVYAATRSDETDLELLRLGRG